MGSEDTRYLQREVPAFGSTALDVAELLPELRWPEQIEICAGNYFVRPRYEVIKKHGRRRIAHANVERTDLKGGGRRAAGAPRRGGGGRGPAPGRPAERY